MENDEQDQRAFKGSNMAEQVGHCKTPRRVGRLQIGTGSGVHVQFKPTGSKGNGIREGDFD